MTRVEAIVSQLRELTDSERQELREILEVEWIQDDLQFDAQRLDEARGRLAEFKAGTSVVDDKETVFRSIEQNLQAMGRDKLTVRVYDPRR